MRLKPKSPLYLALSAVLGLFVITAAAEKAKGQNTFPTPSGNVGVGTTSPGTLLHVKGGGSFTGPGNANTPFIIEDNSATAGHNKWGFTTRLTDNDLGISDLFNNVTRLYINGSGNVGIGTTSPSDLLHVNGILRISSPSGTGAVYHRFVSTGGLGYVGLEASSPGGLFSTGGLAYSLGISTGNSTALQFGTNNAARMTIDPSGNVGIGTTSPGAFLSLGTRITTSVGNGNFLRLYDSGTNSYGWGINTNNGEYAQTAGTGGFLTYYTANTERLRITSGGNVGIGVPSPAVALDVQGDIQASGVIKAKYQDVAEWVPSSEQLAAGTVVVLDSTKSNHVTSSTVSYDTRVAGVVSEQPGISLGEKADGKVLVATTGRVRVKVDATKSPIHIGDLLVTSDVPGVAMKSEPVNLGGVQLHRPGTLIGKALEPLQKGKGAILALLSLQ